MSEMAKKLQARKARTEAPAANQNDHVNSGSSEPTVKPIATLPKANKSTLHPPDVSKKLPTGAESPSMLRRAQPQSEQTSSSSSSSAPAGAASYSAEIETLKQDLLSEMHKELQKIKTEIIEAIVSELNRR